MKKFFFTLFILLFTNILFAIEVPNLSGPVVDQTKTIDWNTERQLEASLKNFKLSYGTQIQLLVVKSLEGESIEGFSMKVADKWKLGTKGGDNGVLFLIAKDDRKLRIEVGQGLEGSLTDLQSGRIIDTVVPFFKRNDYQAGIVVGLSGIANALGGDLQKIPTFKRKKRRRKREGFSWITIIIIMIMVFGRSRRSGLGWILLSGTSGSSFGGGGSGGGGWSGGGGGFSGGGSSGSW